MVSGVWRGFNFHCHAHYNNPLRLGGVLRCHESSLGYEINVILMVFSALQL